MKVFFSSLKSRSILWVVASMLAGISATFIWTNSLVQWERHLHKSYIAGVVLFENLKTGQSTSKKIEIEALSGQSSKLADAGLFRKLPNVSASDFITQISLNPETEEIPYSSIMSVTVISPNLNYPVSDLTINPKISMAEKFGNITRLLATYCSDSILFIKSGEDKWLRVDGNKIWGCGVFPTDFRLPALVLIFSSLVILITLVMNTTASFESFTEALSKRGLIKGSGHYEIEGPAELRAMIQTINNYLDIEQESLARRATFLSGVSHDLGTPATRLRLRAQTITDTNLRDKLNNDIDQMTGMIESVLLYTQSEMKLEELRQISLQSLVDAIVSDFQDASLPVKFIEQDTLSVSARTILFNSKPKFFNTHILSSQNVIVNIRPLSMRRAITNLIDNALKYGRKANISLQADSQKASIIVDDYGNSETAENLRELTIPFKRGKNAANIKGNGIGLTIVSTIAEQHGGSLSFDNWEHGVRAILSIPR